MREDDIPQTHPHILAVMNEEKGGGMRPSPANISVVKETADRRGAEFHLVKCHD